MHESASEIHEEIADTYLIKDLAQLKALADPLRVKILEALAEEARTTKQVAERIGEKPTKLYHHVDALEKAGFVTLRRTRQNRGTLEKYFRAVARVFRADPDLFKGVPEEDSWQSISARLFEQSAAELRSVREKAGDPEPLIVNVLLSASNAEAEALRQRLESMLEDISAGELTDSAGKAEAEKGPPQIYRLVLGLYPVEDSGA